MTRRHARDDESPSTWLLFSARAVLALGVAVFIVGVVLHAAEAPGAQACMFTAFATCTLGVGLLATAHRPRASREKR